MHFINITVVFLTNKYFSVKRKVRIPVGKQENVEGRSRGEPEADLDRDKQHEWGAIILTV